MSRRIPPPPPDRALEARCLALAGALQFSYWALQIATHGEQRTERMLLAVDSLLCTEPERAEDVFSGRRNLSAGLQLLARHMDRSASAAAADRQALRSAGHILGQLLRHASRLLQLPRTLDDIGAALRPLQAARAQQEQLQTEWLTELAALYKKYISPMQPRIMVSGNPMYLQNEAMAAAIRCLLFAALRACILWRQSGGQFWQLLFGARAMRREVQRLLATLPPSSPQL